MHWISVILFRSSYLILIVLPTLTWCFSMLPTSASWGSRGVRNNFPTSARDCGLIKYCSHASQNKPRVKNKDFQLLSTNNEFGSKNRNSDKKNQGNHSGNSTEDLKKIYSAPALYDLAMGYRNYEREVEFLLDAHQRYSPERKRPTSVLEVASGPGRHCMEALKSNLVGRAVALDLSPEMVEYGTGVAKTELGDKISNFHFLCADMRTFTLDEPCNSAWILAGSLQHMTTNEDVIECFSAIRQALSPDGTLIVELPHPNEIFNIIYSTTNSWEVPLEDENGKAYGELQVVWGDENDEINPIKQVRQNTVVLNLKGVENAEKQSVRGVVPLKLFTAQEMALFARITGWEIATMYGALSEEVDINDEDTAYRLVCILRKA